MGLDTKKQVTNEQFQEAYYGGLTHESKVAAKNNRGILRGVSSRFVKSKSMDEDDASSCEMAALFRCLQSHEDGHGKKFTTSLYMFAMFECCRQATKNKRRRESARISQMYLPVISRYVVDEHDTWSSSGVNETPPEIEEVDSMDEISTHIEKLPFAWQKTILQQYYFQGMTCEQIGFTNGGYSKETARMKLDTALSELKLLCQSV